MERSFGSKYGKWIALTAVVLALVLWFVLSGGVENYRAKYEGYDLSQQIGDIGRSSTYSLYPSQIRTRQRQYSWQNDLTLAAHLIVAPLVQMVTWRFSLAPCCPATQMPDPLKLLDMHADMAVRGLKI